MEISFISLLYIAVAAGLGYIAIKSLLGLLRWGMMTIASFFVYKSALIQYFFINLFG